MKVHLFYTFVSLCVFRTLAQNGTRVSEIVSSYTPGSGVVSHIVGGFLKPIDIILHRNASDSSSRENSMKPSVEDIIEDSFIEPVKNIADSIDSQLKAIFPGTQWCGSGDRARNKDDLGVFFLTDDCCREHDNCPDNIPASGSGHGLNNTGLFTRSHCDCDDRFYNCLKKTNTTVSRKIGFAYFNILRPQCFRKEYPITGCEERAGLILRRCERYKMNTSAPKQWQWFDSKEF